MPRAVDDGFRPGDASPETVMARSPTDGANLMMRNRALNLARITARHNANAANIAGEVPGPYLSWHDALQASTKRTQTMGTPPAKHHMD